MKKLFSIVMIALMSIVTLNAETTRIYCKMSQSWWKADGAAVGCHSWGTGQGTSWPGVRMTPVEGETDMWYIDLDVTKVQNVIFTRVNPSDQGNLDWGAKTKDLQIPNDDKNLFTITSTEAVWGDPGCEGEWSKYEVPVPTEPAVTKIEIDGDMSVAGSELTFWVTVAGFSAEPRVTFEVKAGEGEYEQLPGNKFTPTATGDYTIKATAINRNDEKGIYEEAYKEVEFTIGTPAAGITVNVTVPVGTPTCYFYGEMSNNKFVEMDKVDDTHYTTEFPDATTIGWGYLFAWENGNWNTKNADPEGDIKVEPVNGVIDVEVKAWATAPQPVDVTYYLVGYINGANVGCDEDYETLPEEYKFVDGTLTTTFTETSYVFVKMSDNNHWYLSENYVEPAAKVTAILENGKDYGEKVGVNANVEVTFTLTENADGSVTLSYEEAAGPVITYKDTAYYVAGNFTNWAEEMQALPYEVELPADSALEFKQVMLRTVLSDGDSIGQDTTWYGQANEGAKMTRESSAWTLDGGYNVLAVTDIAGTYTFSMDEKGHFVLGWPKEPVITYKDTAYYVAGNFTNWAADMKALPYEVELPADSALEFKQIMLRTILSDGDSIGQDTTWYGQENEGFYMTRGNSEWILNGEFNVFAKTDIKGMYSFSMNEEGAFVITWPEIPVKYYAKNNWNGAAADDWSWLEMSATDRENIYMLDSVVFGGTGVNINDKEEDATAIWFAADKIRVLDGLDGFPGPIPPDPKKRDTLIWAPARTSVVLETPTLLAGDTIKLFFNAKDSTLSAAIVGRPEQPEPVGTFDLTIVQDTLWTKDGGKVAGWIWGEELAGEWTAWATDEEGVLTLKVNVKADSIILVRNAPEAEVPTWEVWNRIDAGEIDECHLFIITNWNEGVWCERPEPCEGQFGILVNEIYIPAALNEAREDVVEYMLLDVALNAGDLVQIYDKCNEVAWIITEYMPDSYQFHVTPENKYIIQDGEADTYSFYFQLGPDKLYVLKGQSPTGMNEIESNATIQKIVRDGHLYIMVNEQVYNVQGIRVQ